MKNELKETLDKSTMKGQEGPEVENFKAQLQKDIESKYQKKRDFLKFSMERARFEDRLHALQEGSKKYEKMWDNYLAFDPIVLPREAKEI
jgi:hypothetical protein